MLVNVGRFLVRGGEVQRAAAAFTSAATIIGACGGLAATVACIVGIGGALAIAGHERAAARSLGAVDAAGEALGFVFEEADRADLARGIAVAHSRLSDEEWRRAHAEGAAMSLDDAADLAFALASELAEGTR